MSNYRQIHTKIWKDGWFIDLPSDYKLLFIYLFSNERANLIGLYDLPLKVIAFETDLDMDTIESGLAHFAEAGKAFYDEGWVWVRSLLHYNARNLASEKIQKHLVNTLDELPDIGLKQKLLSYYQDKIGYLYPMIPPDTVSIPNPTEQDQEQELEQEYDQEQEQDDLGAFAPPDTPPPDISADYEMIRQAYIELFPDKPKPRSSNKTLQGKVKTRMRSKHFRENWHAGLERASTSKFIRAGPWFDLAWYLKNDDNYERCLNGKYDDKGARKDAKGSDSDTIVLQGGYVPYAADPAEFTDAPG